MYYCRMMPHADSRSGGALPVLIARTDRVRPATAHALAMTVLLAVAFTIFAGFTTQFQGIRRGSPWLNDPYNCVVSLTMLIEPMLAALIGVRAALNHCAKPVPVFRVRQLLRAGLVSTVLVAATIAVDGLAAALRVDHPLWNGDTSWMIAALIPLAVGVLATFLALVRACRLLPRQVGEPDGDWLEDLAPVVALGSRRLADQLGRSSLIPFIRKHIIAFAAGASITSAILVVGALAVGERWTDPFLVVFALVLYSDAVFAFCLICNVVLQIAVPSRTGGSALWLGVVAGSLAAQLIFAVRDSIWADFGGVRGSQAVWQLTLLCLSGALVVGAAAGFIRSGHRRRPPSPT